jgi:hypothetical protein
MDHSLKAFLFHSKPCGYTFEKFLGQPLKVDVTEISNSKDGPPPLTKLLGASKLT